MGGSIVYGVQQLAKVHEIKGSLYGVHCAAYRTGNLVANVVASSDDSVWWDLGNPWMGGKSNIDSYMSDQIRLTNWFPTTRICCTILGPSFMTAANFVILGKVIERLGYQYSRLSPKLYTIVFVICDIVALVVQAVGGAKASLAVQLRNEDPEKGARIMVGGIIFQMAAITVYTLLAAEFLLRYHFDRPVRATMSPGSETTRSKPQLDTRITLMILGLSISTLFIYIRSIYRTIELLDGWTGPIITNQLYFDVLDGMPIVVAMYAINIFHPSFLLNHRVETGESGLEEKE
ncbi:unnamed protein product [Rhizoctonia solani]|uniref:Sphingoid long-chain base transporter RSB1 n=1 Tax=Rhizoctonia solani TaxID=456999 RepID=A0A8H3DDK0_9AGAM|nr:unnamed protein product [Rhizoctonia solani]